MQRNRTANTNTELKKAQAQVVQQNQVIQQCVKKIIELETIIVSLDAETKIKPFVNLGNGSLHLRIKILFPNSPRVYDIEKIHKITDKYFLIDLESKYDKFIVNNQQVLMLYNLIEDMLDIRDAILIRVGRLQRQERLNGIL
jgi:hypothetical protein